MNEENDFEPICNVLADAAQTLFVLGRLPDSWFDDNIKKHHKVDSEAKTTTQKAL